MEGLTLITAHLLGDFVFQTKTMAEEKMASARVRAVHCFVHLALFAIVAGLLWSVLTGFLYALILSLVHFVIDSRRWVRVKGELLHADWEPYAIVIDQTFHILTIVGLYWLFVITGMIT